ncbi:hypothetical protein SUGI_0431380 [Cryptomeria japonica]|uniref:flavanone 3-dioxygenase 2 n=1 Tax=Cryptomeria japonica TaxID=3369 RepID=UPI002408AC14|nr:flavanone 3-dioxygenase 2 [Cryptomeria japonica]XP_057837536.2 flavanone 3-dioxygenase 2 [Cryptomeria japonica]GLJ22873.1 hypothetical protein SUGI_0431380 [Cryptomeria japonica]
MAKQLLAREVILRDERSSCKRSVMFSGSNHCLEIPKAYIRPPAERPKLNEVASLDNISVLDLAHLNGPNRPLLIDRIRSACRQDGFFQVINHGVSEEVINRLLEVAKEFFTMPIEKREKFYSEDPSSVIRLSTSFNVEKEEVYNWREFLRHHCYPLEKYVDTWPLDPPAYREAVGKYCTEVRALALRLLAAISESLGLEPDFLEKALGQQAQHMAINYYPRCPNPELTFGLPAHSDPNALTILLQGDVSGLQVFKNGQWCTVHPARNAFVVNIGDQLQVLSNGIYKSAIHRALVNAAEARISVPTFYCPSPDALIAPVPSLVTSDNPAQYRKFTYEEYYQMFWSKNLEGNTCLNFFTVDSTNVSPPTEDDNL